MADLSLVQDINEIVKPMQRGQITIPVNIRKKLNITPKTWLWVKLVKDKILIEPVENFSLSSSLLSYLDKAASDPKIYWTQQDSANLNRARKKSSQRLKRLV